MRASSLLARPSQAGYAIVMSSDEPQIACIRVDPALLTDPVPFEVAVRLLPETLRIGTCDGPIGGVSFAALSEAFTLTDDDRRFVDFLVRDAVTEWLAES